MPRVIANPTLRRALRSLATSATLATLFAAPGIAHANPQGASVANGSAVFSTPDPSTLNITTSNGTIINWQSFGINPSEVTRFLQQGASAAVLNRVVGGDPSAILGSLLSNGRVFLINPNGVVFGPNATVDTAGLVVSTLNMSDEDFIAGRLHFSGDSTSGAVVNQGHIRSQGSVMLIAPRIENSGLIETADGGLLLAAGRVVTITSFENPEIGYQLQAPDNEVVNLGQLIANGGAASVFAGSIRHSGDIDANAISLDEHGRVQLVASAEVTLEAGSTISADGARGGEILVHSTSASTTLDGATLSARGDNGVGGDVRVLGDEVKLTGATTIDASGRDGGGQVLIGGDWQGANAQVANARNTRVDRDTNIAADALLDGDGGKIIVWSDNTTQSAGTITARGGAQGGDGGFVEVSGKVALGFSSFVDTRAPHGRVGTLLLDPQDIVVASGGGAPLLGVDDALDSSAGAGCDGTTCTIDPAAINGAGSAVVLQASRDITISNAISIVAAGVSFTAQANDDIIVNASITTNNADIVLQANQANGGMPATNTGSVLINQALNSNGGMVLVNGGDQIIMSGLGAINAGSGAVDLTVPFDAAVITAGNIQLTNIATTGDVRIVNQNGTFGSSIVQDAAGGGTTGTRVLVENEFASGGTIGTLADPIRIGDGVQLESHAHNPLSIIAIKGLGDLTIGDGGSGVLKGVQAAGGGDIDIDVVGTLTLKDPGGGTPGSVQTAGGAGDTINLVAGNGIVINADINADTEAVTLDGGAGGITQGALGSVTSGMLKVLASTGIQLDSTLNNIAQLTADNSTGGNISIANSGGDLALVNNATAFAVRNQASGAQIVIDNDASNIDINDDLQTNNGDIFLDTTGNISQTGAGVITASVLNIANASQALLNSTTNQIVGLVTTGITGDLTLLNNSGGSALGLNNIDSLGGNIDISNSGGISVIGTVSSFSLVSLTESVNDINGTGAESVLGDNVQLTASAGGIGNGTALRIHPSLSSLALNTGGAGAAGDIAIKVTGAFNTGKISTLNTSGASQQKVFLETTAGALTVDSVFGNATDALELVSLANSINYSSGSLSGVSIDLTADASIGAPFAAGSLQTQTGFINASSVSGGTIVIDNTGDVSVTGLTTPGGGIIELNQYSGTGNVFIDGPVDAGSAGPVRLATSAGTLHVNADVTAVSQIELTTTGGLADDVVIAPGVTVNATGFGSAAVINSSGDVAQDGSVLSQQGDVSLTAAGDYNMGASALARSAIGMVTLAAGGSSAIAKLEAPGGPVQVSAAGGSVTDSNGSTVNVLAADLNISAANSVGSFVNPLETQLPSLSNAVATSGEIGINNTGALAIGFNIATAAGNDLYLRSSTGLDILASAASGARLVLDAGSGALGLNSVLVSALTSLSLRGSTIDVLSGSMVTANTVSATSSGTTRIDAMAGGPTSITAIDSAAFNVGTLVVQGGSAFGGSAKIDAANSLTVNASNVLIAGGAGSGASASIDPVNVTINSVNNIVLQGGTGLTSVAEIVADNLVKLNAGGSVNLTGDQGAAVVNSVLGNVDIIAASGVNLLAGLGSFGDAVIVANNGLGTVNITTSSCANCVLLALDPFANIIAEAGIFAASLNLLDLGGVVGDDSVDLSAKDILVLEELAERLAADSGAKGGDDDEEDDRKICR